MVDFSLLEVPKILRFLHMTGDSLFHSPDKAAQNPRVFNFWGGPGRDKKENASVLPTDVVYQIAIKQIITNLRGRASLYLGNTDQNQYHSRQNP